MYSHLYTYGHPQPSPPQDEFQSLHDVDFKPLVHNSRSSPQQQQQTYQSPSLSVVHGTSGSLSGTIPTFTFMPPHQQHNPSQLSSATQLQLSVHPLIKGHQENQQQRTNQQQSSSTISSSHHESNQQQQQQQQQNNQTSNNNTNNSNNNNNQQDQQPQQQQQQQHEQQYHHDALNSHDSSHTSITGRSENLSHHFGSFPPDMVFANSFNVQHVYHPVDISSIVHTSGMTVNDLSARLPPLNPEVVNTQPNVTLARPSVLSELDLQQQQQQQQQSSSSSSSSSHYPHHHQQQQQQQQHQFRQQDHIDLSPDNHQNANNYSNNHNNSNNNNVHSNKRVKLNQSSQQQPKVSRERAPWTPEEDNLLRLAVQLYGDKTEKWAKIAACVPGRTNKNCRKRWFHSLDPSLRKGAWTDEEDQLLREGVMQFPNQWSKIADMLEGRTDDQCAKRWRESLDPTIDRSDWTPMEDQRLMEKYEEYSSQWQKIAQFFDGRPGLHCRNRWRKLQRMMQMKKEKENAAAAAVAALPTTTSFINGLADEQISRYQQHNSRFQQNHHHQQVQKPSTSSISSSSDSSSLSTNNILSITNNNPHTTELQQQQQFGSGSGSGSGGGGGEDGNEPYSDLNPYGCDIPGCYTSFPQSSGLFYHMKSAHPNLDGYDKPYRCAMPHCSKRYKNINGLQYHLREAKGSSGHGVYSNRPRTISNNKQPQQPQQAQQQPQQQHAMTLLQQQQNQQLQHLQQTSLTLPR